jgi:hypothetical protein
VAAAPVFRWCGAVAQAREQVQFVPGAAQDFAVQAAPAALFPVLEWERVWLALPVWAQDAGHSERAVLRPAAGPDAGLAARLAAGRAGA